MIDEELYQQAADELNTDKRRPHIWARACALASDDHDEARFLYTNLRVEELQAERQQRAESGSTLHSPTAPIEIDGTLALEPLKDDSGLEDEVDSSTEEIPSSISAPSGVDQRASVESDSEIFGLTPLEDSAEDVPESIERKSFAEQFSPNDAIDAEAIDANTIDPEAIDRQEPRIDTQFETNDLLSEQSTDDSSTHNLEDTYAGGDDTIDVFQQEIDAVRAEQGDRETFLDTGAFSRSLDGEDNASEMESKLVDTGNHQALDDTDSEFDTTTELNLSAQDIADLTLPEVIATPANDNAQSPDNSSSMSTTLDDVLDDAHYVPPSPVDPADDSMNWLDESVNANRTDEGDIHTREPTIYEEDTLVDELERQARELPEADNAVETVIEPAVQQPDHSESDTIPSAPSLDDVSDRVSATETTADADAAAIATVAAGAAGAAAVATGQPVSTPDDALLYPLDLTEDGHGKQYAVYRRNNSAQAVKQGVSWSALIMTLPFLIYRHLFGTAIVYGLVWLIMLGGLIVSGLAWMDAGAGAAPIVKTCTICFALMAFIGLVYLPFQHGNRWRGEKLENRGYELIAFAKARSPGKAIARVRAASGFD